MNKIKHLTAFLLLIVLSCVAAPLSLAQNLNYSNLSSSPYNRYGYGCLGDRGNAVTRAMGETGIALRSNLYTNLQNPASLTAIDTLTMLFEMGLSGQYAQYSEPGASLHKWDAGFSYLSMHFPLWRNFAASLSLQPYSTVGYLFGSQHKEPLEWNSVTQKVDTLVYTHSFAGVGGINNFMFGLGWRAFRTKMHEANLGVNVGYLWGTVNNSSSVLVTSGHASGTAVSHNIDARGLYLKFGLQYLWRLNAANSLTLGATYSPELNLSLDAQTLKISVDTLQLDDRFRNDIKTPMSFGVGLAYNWRGRLTATGEWERTRWSTVYGVDANQGLDAQIFRNVNRVAVGIDYLPRYYSQHYFQTCHYRAGFSAQNSYITVDGNGYKEYNATAGIGLPIGKRNQLHLSFGYTHRAPELNTMLKENYFKFTVGLTFNEMMFYRSLLR